MTNLWAYLDFTPLFHLIKNETLQKTLRRCLLFIKCKLENMSDDFLRLIFSFKFSHLNFNENNCVKSYVVCIFFYVPVFFC